MGSMMALEAIKLIAGAGTPLRGALLIYDALHAETRRIRARPRPDARSAAARGRGRTARHPGAHDRHAPRRLPDRLAGGRARRVDGAADAAEMVTGDGNAQVFADHGDPDHGRSAC